VYSTHSSCLQAHNTSLWMFLTPILGKSVLFFHLSLAGVISTVAHIIDATYATSHFSQMNGQGFAVVLMESISMTPSPCLLSLCNMMHLLIICLSHRCHVFLILSFPSHQWRQHTHFQLYLVPQAFFLSKVTYSIMCNLITMILQSAGFSMTVSCVIQHHSSVWLRLYHPIGWIPCEMHS
jgi:hypothetical protein